MTCRLGVLGAWPRVHSPQRSHSRDALQGLVLAAPEPRRSAAALRSFRRRRFALIRQCAPSWGGGGGWAEAK